MERSSRSSCIPRAARLRLEQHQIHSLIYKHCSTPACFGYKGKIETVLAAKLGFRCRRLEATEIYPVRRICCFQAHLHHTTPEMPLQSERVDVLTSEPCPYTEDVERAYNLFMREIDSTEGWEGSASITCTRSVTGY